MPSRPQPVVKDPGKLLTIRQLGAYLQVSRSKIYRLLDAGMPHLRIGYEFRFQLFEVLHWFADNAPADYQDERPRRQSTRTPVPLQPRAPVLTDDERAAHAARRAELRRRRLSGAALEGGSNAAS